mgnify:CR=1|jgi:hypothetical protein
MEFDNKNKTCKERISENLQDRAEDFKIFMSADDLEDVSEDLGSFYNYGLCFDFVEPNTFNDQKEGYYRYQLSWGGPSDEILFYQDGTIEYWFKDWFDGAKMDITSKDWAIWVKEYFEEVGSMDWQDVTVYEYAD